jgi:hypothetical protein
MTINSRGRSKAHPRYQAKRPPRIETARTKRGVAAMGASDGWTHSQELNES